MKKIEKLTKEQEALFPVYSDKWLAIGLSTRPCDRSKAEDAARRAYRVAGLEPPTQFIWFDSPLSMAIGDSLIRKGASVRDSVWASVWASVGDSVRASVWASVWASVRASVGDPVRDSVRDSVWDSVRASVRDSVWDSVRASVYGSQDAGWLSFYNYFQEICELEACEKLRPLMDLAKECGWWLPRTNICLMSEKPIRCTLKDGVIHNDNYMAVEYKDGFGVWALNGVRVPEYLVTTKAEDLNIQDFLKEQNADIKAEFIRKFGIERMKDMGKVVDSYERYDSEWFKKSEYELVDMSAIFTSLNYAPYLKMKNQTTGVIHLEGVDPGCRTIQDAMTFRTGIDFNNVEIGSIM